MRGTPKSTVLLVEDHPIVADATVELLEDAGCRVLGPAGSIRDAQALIGEERPDLALIDLGLPDGNGTVLVERLVGEGVRCAVLTGDAAPETRRGVLKDVPWIEKPLTSDQVRRLLEDGDIPI